MIDATNVSAVRPPAAAPAGGRATAGRPSRLVLDLPAGRLPRPERRPGRAGRARGGRPTPARRACAGRSTGASSTAEGLAGLVVLTIPAEVDRSTIRLTKPAGAATLSPSAVAAPDQETQAVNDRWRTIAIILAVILALLGGIAAAVVITGGPAPVVLPSPTTAAGSSSQPSARRLRPSRLGRGPSAVPAGRFGRLPRRRRPVADSPGQPDHDHVHLDAARCPEGHAWPALPGRSRSRPRARARSRPRSSRRSASGADDRLPQASRRVGASAVPARRRPLTGTTTRAKTNWTRDRDRQRQRRADPRHRPDLRDGHPSVTLTNGRFDGKMYQYDGATFRLTDPARRLARDQGQLGRARRSTTPCSSSRPRRRPTP